jgi:glycosyltransferase involved in cell wall biosynthesis
LKRILFVSHDATRTGAPIVLLHLLRWLKANTDYDIHILLLANGPMVNEFSEVSTTYLWEKDWKISFSSKVRGRIFKQKMYTINQNKILDAIGKIKFDLIYLNTVVSTHIIPELVSLTSCPIVCHIHENEYSINYFYPNALRDSLKKHITHYITVSESTKRSLINIASIPPDDISLCYEFVPTDQLSKITVDKTQMKSTLGLSDEFIVGGSGVSMWRKGIDLFIQLAFELESMEPDHGIKFLWVGPIDHSFKCSFDYEKVRLGIDKDVILTGQVSDPGNYFQIFDVFTLTSREDPFPLVCLEAASLSKPILCFENSGGMVEFLKEEESLIIPYGNVKLMAKRILELRANAKERKRLGDKMKINVGNYDVNVRAPLINSIIQSFLPTYSS